MKGWREGSEEGWKKIKWEERYRGERRDKVDGKYRKLNGEKYIQKEGRGEGGSVEKETKEMKEELK